MQKKLEMLRCSVYIFLMNKRADTRTPWRVK
jgi:hypothetical protein